MKAPKQTKKFSLLPAGTHAAVCFGVWDLGWQMTEWNGVKKPKPQIMLAFETSERIESNDEYNGQRFRIYKSYTFNVGDRSTLSKDLQGWQGTMSQDERDDFDFDGLITQNCLLNVVHNESGDRTYANIAGISPLIKGMTPMTPENPRTEPDWVLEKKKKAVDPDEHEEEAIAF